jgi:hypothetical protein
VIKVEELDSPAFSMLGVQLWKLSNIDRSSDGWLKIYYLKLLRVSEGLWSRLYLQSLAPTNPYCARVVGYGTFSLWVIRKEYLCPSSGDINRLMMMIKVEYKLVKFDIFVQPNVLLAIPKLDINVNEQNFSIRTYFRRCLDLHTTVTVDISNHRFTVWQ